jgi:hypothetical protein
MRIPQPSRVSRVRGAVVAVFAAMVLALPLGVLASHQFSDVPNSNIFHGDVDALVDAGVTAGCGGGKYCPNQAVTRGQMAAFMNRLGALAPGKVPVVNADRLDGYHANGLTRVAGDGALTLTPITSNFPTFQTAADVVINAPAAGFVLVDASFVAQNTAETCSGFTCGVFARLHHVQTGDVSPYVVVDVHGGTHPNATASVSFAFDVAAGNNTFRVEVARGSGAEAPGAGNPQITALYSPFGSTGGSTLSVQDTPITEGAQVGQ